MGEYYLLNADIELLNKALDYYKTVLDVNIILADEDSEHIELCKNTITHIEIVKEKLK